jgi:hypothetical protein
MKGFCRHIHSRYSLTMLLTETNCKLRQAQPIADMNEEPAQFQSRGSDNAPR